MVGFVVESTRRVRTIHEMARRRSPGGVAVLTAVAEELLDDPLAAIWSTGEVSLTIRQLATERPIGDPPILVAGCLADIDAVAALDDRGAQHLPAIKPYLRR